MHQFSIRDIENLTNIKAHTIRIWEQRYGLCGCKRKKSNHRFYDEEDLKQILRIAWLYHHGYKISHIARMSTAEIREKALLYQDVAAPMGHLLPQLTEAAIDLDTETIERLVVDCFGIYGVEQSVLELVFPFLSRMGLFWMTGHIIPAQEHLASNIVVHQLCLAIERLPASFPAPGDRKVLLFAPESEYHEIPLLFMSYLLKKHGVAYYYLGSSVSIPAIQLFYKKQPVSEFYFHQITRLANYERKDYLEALAEAFPKSRIYCSGVELESRDTLPENILLLKTRQELLAFATRIHTDG